MAVQVPADTIIIEPESCYAKFGMRERELLLQGSRPTNQRYAGASSYKPAIGRKTMEGFTTSVVETVEQFEHEACTLSCGVCNACPKRYCEHPNDKDPINVAWNEATELTMRAMNALEVLGDVLRKEDRVAGPGPTAEFFDEKDDPNPDNGLGPDGNGSATKA